MKHSIIVALVVGLVSSVGILARAEDAPGAHQTANERDPTTVKKPAKGTTQTNSLKTDAQSPADVGQTDYRLMKANCSSVASAGRAQCVKEAKGKDNAAVTPKTKEILWRCEDLRSREERECIIRELEGQHADPGRPGQGGNGAAEVLPPPPR